MRKHIPTIIVALSVAANLAAMLLSLSTIGRSRDAQAAAVEALQQARRDLGLSELRARQALDELHSLKAGKPSIE